MRRAAVAYAGGAAAHAAVAAKRLSPPGGELVGLRSFGEVARAAASGEVGYGVLPIESSLAGPIAETHDLLWESSLSIVAETVIPIRHQLVARRHVPLEHVRVIRSHPAALEQCRRLLESLPHVRTIPAATTAEAAAHVAESGEEGEVAIASQRAADIHDLVVLAQDVGDQDAFTRFVSVATHTRLDGPGVAWRTAFSFVTDHRPGALHRALEPFARLGIDLLQLVSRPIPAAPWTYRFDCVLAGHPLEEPTREALADLRARVRRVRVFGSYPAGA